MQQLIITKRNLTLTFLSIILGIIFLLGATFLCVKYYDAKNKDTQELITVGEGIQQAVVNNKLDLIVSPPPFPFDKDIIKGREIGRKNPERERIPFSMVVFDKNGKVLNKFIGGRFNDEEEILGFFQYKNKKGIFEDDGVILQFISLEQGNTLLIFKPLRYPIEDFLFDVLLFLVVMGVFSLPLFFIVRYFVNRTLKPVEENMKDMQDFVHNAGHELKTPLAVMHGNLQIARELKSYDPYLNKEMLLEVEKMNQLIEGLVELSYISKGNEVTTFSLYQEIKDIVDSFDKKLKEKNIECIIEKSANPKVEVNKGYFYILFSNLFLNAIKYNSQNGKIVITLKKNGFIIKDTGIGIEKEFHSKIFERFFKVDSSRNSSGFGIGLSLVKKVAEIYGWKIEVKSEKGEGTSFEVEF